MSLSAALDDAFDYWAGCGKYAGRRPKKSRPQKLSKAEIRERIRDLHKQIRELEKQLDE